MTPETECILEQLYEAISGARSYGKTMFVYHDEGQWFYSGKLPCDTKDYYIAYPNGEIDRSDCVPNFSKEDLLAYAIKTQRPPAFAPEGRKPKKFKKKLKNSPPQVKEKEENWMPIKKKMFLCYCGFAPFVAAAFALMVNHLLFTPSEGLEFTTALFCLPMSVFFALVALHRPKNGTKAAIASWLATDSHLSFYAFLYLETLRPFNPLVHAIIIMACMMIAGVAVLMLWDNDAGEVKAA